MPKARSFFPQKSCSSRSWSRSFDGTNSTGLSFWPRLTQGPSDDIAAPTSRPKCLVSLGISSEPERQFTAKTSKSLKGCKEQTNHKLNSNFRTAGCVLGFDITYLCFDQNGLASDAMLRPNNLPEAMEGTSFGRYWHTMPHSP